MAKPPTPPSRKQQDSEEKTDTRTTGSTASYNETPVSTAENPEPPHGSPGGQTRGDAREFTGDPSSRHPLHVHGETEAPGAYPAPTPPPRRSGPDYKDSSGRDHPAQSEHDHARNELHGESDRRLQKQTPKSPSGK